MGRAAGTESRGDNRFICWPHYSAALSFRWDKMEMKDGYGAVNMDGVDVVALTAENNL